MKYTDHRLNKEIEHGRKIKENAEVVWNWASPAGQIRSDRRADLFVSVGRITSKDRVLEIGCGTGLFTRKVFSRTGAIITATDLSSELLSQAKELHPNAIFMVDDAMNMKFESNSYDIVFGSSILHHLEIEKALSEIYRVLKPGGRIVFAEPNMLNPQILVQKNIPYIKEKLGDSPDETAIVRWKFRSQMNKKGFVKIQISPYDFLHPITPRFLSKAVNSLGQIFEKIPLIREVAGSVIIYAEKPV